MLNQYGFTDDNGNALAVDGVIGPKTQQVLDKMNIYQQHLSKPDASTSAWQAQLNDWGYKDASGMPLQVDGVYGPKTDAATKSFENNFFDGFTGGTNQKKTVQTKTFPTMPKTNDDQIQAAVAPGSSTANTYDPLGQSFGYTTKSISQQPDNTLTASQKLLQSLQNQKNNGTQATAATLPTQTSIVPAETYTGITGGNPAQNTGTSGQSMLDMIAAMNKPVNAGTAANQDPGFTIGNNTAASQDPGFSARQSIAEKHRPELKDSGFTLWNNADSGQDNGNATGSSTAVINKAFNDYNRNAGLDKSKVVELASSSDNPVEDFFSDIGKGAENVWDNVVKFFAPHTTDNSSKKIDEKNYNISTNALDKMNTALRYYGYAKDNPVVGAFSDIVNYGVTFAEIDGLYKDVDARINGFAQDAWDIGAEMYNKKNDPSRCRYAGQAMLIPMTQAQADKIKSGNGAQIIANFITDSTNSYNDIMTFVNDNGLNMGKTEDLEGKYWAELSPEQKNTFINSYLKFTSLSHMSDQYWDYTSELVKNFTANAAVALLMP